jgi:DNA (cytosine-5)-methyltransferase 1
MEYTCVDTFCGAGGMSLGLSWAGFKHLLSFDSDYHCSETMQLNKKYFSHQKEQASIEEYLNGKLLKRINVKIGDLFLLAGGPPCQGFSVQRIGKDSDKRNDLVYLFFKLVKEAIPKFFLMENVPGIKGKRGKSFLTSAISYAEEAGYWVHLGVLDAQDFGVPQRRKRVFLIGERKDFSCPSFKFPKPTTSEGFRKTVRQTIEHLPPPPDNCFDHPQFTHHRKDKLSELNKKRLQALRPGQGRENLPKKLLAECHKRDANSIGHRNVYGRMSWDEVAPTLTARFDSFTRGLFGHPEQIRSISLREGALLQTFPIDFRFFGNKVDIARQIGNAVPPLLAKAIGKQIIKCYKYQQKKKELLFVKKNN